MLANRTRLIVCLTCAFIACGVLVVPGTLADKDRRVSSLTADVNGDGVYDGQDIADFALILEAWSDFVATFPEDVQTALSLLDFNDDGTISEGDLPGFEAAFAVGFSANQRGAASYTLLSSDQRGGTASRTTPLIDLDIDSDNNNGTAFPDRTDDPGEDAVEEDTPGKFVQHNRDDDDDNEEPDFLTDGAISQETGDLVPLVLEIIPSATPLSSVIGSVLKYNLDFAAGTGADLRLWRSPTRGVLSDAVTVSANVDHEDHHVWVIGDCNCDAVSDTFDIDAFVLAITNPASYEATYPNCSTLTADVNLDGMADVYDIDPFVAGLGTANLYPVLLWAEGVPTSVADYGVGSGCLLEATADTNLDTDIDISQGDAAPDRVRIYAGPHDCGVYDDPVTQVPTPSYPYVSKGYDCGDPPSRSTCVNLSGYEGEGSDPMDIHGDGARNGPLPINLASPVAPGDYPPLSTNPTASTSPLVSGDVVHSRGHGAYPERPTLNGVVDLLTGTPLVQETDFVLPFGGAEFRHIRTYAPPAFAHDVPLGHVKGWASHDHFWDWCGRWWMMSEAPIFLIDMRKSYLRTPNCPKRCYFVPDAHHAIPFLWSESQEAYVAPKWFDAALEFTDNPNDDLPPTEFVVWMHNRSIKYVITPQYDILADAYLPDGSGGHHVRDTPPIDTQHMRIDYAGWGWPHFGLVTRIEDRYGNRVEYEYVDRARGNCDENEADDCIECCENCKEIGQIRAIRLRTASGNVAWTLVYRYRGFAPSVYANYIGIPSTFCNMLHSIHIYEGDTATPTWQSTIPGTEFWGDPVTLEAKPPTEGLAIWQEDIAPGWVKRVEYIYTHVREHEHMTDWFWRTVIGLNGGAETNAHLAGVIVTDQPSNGSEATRQYSLYNYGGEAVGGDSTGGEWVWPLNRVYDDTVIKSTLEHNTGYELDDLIALVPADTVQAVQPDGTIDASPWCSIATLTWGEGDISVHADLAAAYIGHDPLRTADQFGTCGILTDRREGRKYYEMHKFLLWPSEMEPAHHPCQSVRVMYGWEARWPYLYIAEELNEETALEVHELHEIPFGDDFHAAIIDEIDGGELISRRIVKMNAAGFVQSERVYSYETDPHGVLDEARGFYERREYDGEGRVTEHRTLGWSAAEFVAGANEDTDGLIYVYEYPTGVGDETARQPIAVGVKKGKTGGVHYLESYERHPARPELVTKATRYIEPVTDRSAATPEQCEVVETFYTFDGSPSKNKPILAKTAARAAAPLAAGGPDRYAITRVRHDSDGNVTHEGSGSVASLSAFSAGDLFSFTYRDYDERGQMLEIAMDTDDGEHEVDGEFEHWAAGGVEALNLITEMEYEDPFGLKHTAYPDGSHMYVLYEIEGDEIEQWTFNDVHGEDYELASPVTVKRYRGGQVVSTQKVEIHGGSLGEAPTAIPTLGYTVLEEALVDYDASGMPVSVSRSKPGSENPADDVTATMTFGRQGQIERSEAPDGTVTRQTYNKRGQVERVYSGTNDADDYWGTEDGLPAGPNPEDNMVLVEKRYYGAGVNDATLLTCVRKYRDKPTNQYWYYDTDEDEWWGGEAPSEDDDGWTTTYEYDWRMRGVWETTRDSAGAPVRHTVTWLDNLDRAVLTAEYGAAAAVDGTALDPRIAAPGAVTPAAATVLNLSPVPLSLRENIYNARGLVEEQRDYDTSTGNYTKTATYYDHADRPVEVHRSGGTIERMYYDGKGRQVRHESVVATGTDIIVSKTETRYNSDDQAIVTKHYERRHDADGTNDEICSYIYSWYDAAGKTIATANFGTASGTYTSGSQPPEYDTLSCPAGYDSGGDIYHCGLGGTESYALCTCYEYDGAGRQSAVWHPDGAVTRTEYDLFGRVQLVTENAEGAADQKRRTAYQYDQNSGQLVAMAAVTPEHNGGQLYFYSDINWTASDDTIQITTFEYDAEVRPTWASPAYSGGWDHAGWSEQSRNHSWISRVTYPNGDWLEFTYYSDGSVASREDSKGQYVIYEYDEQGRLSDVFIDDTAIYTSQSWKPENLIHQIAYTYTADSLLDTVTALSYDYSSGADTQVAFDDFDYDSTGNLDAESQSPLGATAATVDYTWVFRPDATGVQSGYHRLAGLDYPSAGLALSFVYDDDDVSDALGRVTRILDETDSGNPPIPLAQYGYTGTGRRVSRVFGNLVSQTFDADSSAGYECLDEFGRIIDLCYELGATQLHRFRHDYDKAGNRLYDYVNHVGAPNKRSYVYGYDALSRLVSAHMGRLDTSTFDSIITSQTDVPLESDMSWGLDMLGNWTETPGYAREDLHGGSISMDYYRTDTTDFANELTEVTRGDPGVSEPYVYDLAGNLVFDSRFFYQYDAFNRLAQVNLADTLDAATDFDPITGELTAVGGPGIVLAAFTYDGLGRLIQTERYDRLGNSQTETYYYDGVRRIQEICVTTPNGGGSTTEFREYVWGPEYVDEVICQVDEDTSTQTVRRTYYLQNANYNVTGVVDDSGTVLTQYQYTPYGCVNIYDDVATPSDFVNRIGHQGLFFERLYWRANASLLTAPALDEPPNADPICGLYYARNRWYGPELGRFIQRDMNEAGQLVISALAMNGEALLSLLGAFAPESHYGDGMNLHEYAGSNPINRRDALGLSWGDPDIDNIIYNLMGERAAAAAAVTAKVGMAFNTAKLIGEMALSMVPGADAAKLAYALALGNSVTWSDIAYAGLDLSGPVGKIAGAFVGTLAAYKLGAASFARVSANAGGILQAFVRLTHADARAIASGHAWIKHCEDWAHIGIGSADELADIIAGMTKGPGKALSNGRHAWYDAATGMVVIFNPKAADKGTAFIPRDPLRYFQDLK